MFSKGVTKGTKDKKGKLFWYIVVATIPAAIVGVLFEDVIEDAFRSNVLLIACALALMGVLIYFVDKKSKQNKNLEKMSLKDAFLIGCSQVFALIPGFSRSGTTIACARSLQMNREDAAKFSFYLSAPVVLGAVVLQLFKKATLKAIIANLSMFIVGIGTAFVIGLLCIEFLLKYLKKHDFKVFMYYRILLAVVVILWTLL